MYVDGKLLETVKYEPASWKSAVDHIDRIIKIGGREAAGLGTDFDGIEDPPAGLEDVSKLPIIAEELLRRGHSTQVVRGVLGDFDRVSFVGEDLRQQGTNAHFVINYKNRGHEFGNGRCGG